MSVRFFAVGFALVSTAAAAETVRFTGPPFTAEGLDRLRAPQGAVGYVTPQADSKTAALQYANLVPGAFESNATIVIHPKAVLMEAGPWCTIFGADGAGHWTVGAPKHRANPKADFAIGKSAARAVRWTLLNGATCEKAAAAWVVVEFDRPLGFRVARVEQFSKQIKNETVEIHSEGWRGNVDASRKAVDRWFISAKVEGDKDNGEFILKYGADPSSDPYPYADMSSRSNFAVLSRAGADPVFYGFGRLAGWSAKYETEPAGKDFRNNVFYKLRPTGSRKWKPATLNRPITMQDVMAIRSTLEKIK